MGHRLKKSIVMVGMMGAGKTAVGQAVARALEAPFIDSDDEIVRAANMTIAEIFARDGETFFRAREREVIARLLTGDPAVLSTGGGAFLSPETRALISQCGVSIWLRADLDLLWDRVRHKDIRPLLHTPDPRATLAELFKLRGPHYAQADLVVDAHPDYAIDDMTRAVIGKLTTRPDVLEKVA